MLKRLEQCGGGGGVRKFHHLLCIECQQVFMLLEETLESPLGSKEIKPVNP